MTDCVSNAVSSDQDIDLWVRLGTSAAVRDSAVALAAKPDFVDLFEFNLTFARRKWRSKRRDHPPRVAVCGWELSHNAAGRVRTLADLWRPLAETEIIGATFPRWGNTLWAPIREMEIPCHMIHVADEAAFPRQALEHVQAHPYDIVHLSKPRLPNILFGLLYKLVWDARVILDIDDEELGAVGAETTLALEALLQAHGGHPRWEHLGGKDWTRAAVGLWDIFDGTTVSNPALQARYGGPIIAHGRAASQFSPSPERRRASRARFNIPDDKTVVLFFGTPRRHKGLLETAQAIAALGRDDLCYVVAGDFPEPKLKDELTAIEGADIRFLPDQPYDDIADVVALGDICVLLQRDASLLASYQLPAKMVDALAMGLLVLAQPTPALMGAVKAGAVAEVFPHTLTETLRRWLDDPQAMQSVQARGRTWFLDHLEAEQSAAPLAQILSATPPLPAPGILLQRPEQRRLFEQLGGWHMFSPTALPAPPDLKSIEHADTPAKAAVAEAKPDPAPVAAAASQIIVYSVLVGDYEALKEPEAIDPSVRYILFTDNPDLKSETWEVVPLDTLGLSPRRASRMPKLLPHRYLPEHDISIYIDQSLTLLESDIAKMANDALQGFDIAAYPHFERDCVFAEIEECLSLGKVDKARAQAFRDRLQKEQFPRNWGLLENACLVRRNSPVMKRINELWFKEYIEGPERDQFSLMYVLWRAEVPHAVIGNAPNFRKSPHARWTKHEGATACAVQPDPASVTRQFDFLAGLRPDTLVKTVERVCARLLSGQKADGFPAVSTQAMRDAMEAVTWLEMQGYSDDAQKCRNLLSKTLFPQAAPFAPQSLLKLAYIPNAAMPTQAANNVHVMKMCAAFAEIGVDVTLYAERAADYHGGTGREMLDHFGLQSGFPIILQAKDKRGRENLLYRLVRQAIADGCTHIYTRSMEVALYAALADLPVIFEEHKIKGEAEFACQSVVARSPALERIVVISQPLKRLQAAMLRGLERKVSVLHDAADPMRAAPPPFDLGAQDRPGRNIGYVGHLYPGKGAELCHDLARRMPDVTFHMLGGTAEDIAAWQAKSQDLPNLVFHGHRPPADVPGFIAAVDICIAPFLRDVKVSGGRYNVADFFSPLKIFEYMAQGKPIVTSDLPVLREVLAPGETALMCDPDRPESFVAALNGLIADPAQGQRLGQAAKTRLEADFTWTARARAVRALFEAARPRIDPPPAARARPVPVTGERPLMRWYYGGEKQEGWAYGVNARRLSSRIASLDHIAPGALQNADRPLDIALAFDILIMQGEKFNNSGARKKILRIGGPNPLKVFSGGNTDLLRAALGQADALIALSPQLRDELCHIHPSVHFIPNGIDTAAIRPEMRQRAPGSPFRVGMSASMSKEFQRHTKGYYFATEACAAAGVELMVIGRGMRQIPHEQLLAEFWSQIDVLIHPVGAGKEASSNVIMEALAWGVPVITTRHAGFHGVTLEHGREGLLMRRTVGDFVEAIFALQEDAKLCERLASGGRAFVERHHALDVVAREYEDVFWKCLNK